MVSCRYPVVARTSFFYLFVRSLLFEMMLTLLVTGSVSPSTFYMITTILTMINRTWVANLAIFQRRWRLAHACCFVINWHGLLEEDLVANFVVLPNYHEDEAMLRDTLKNLGRSPSPEKQVRIGLTTEAREGPKTQDKAERLLVATGHVFEDVMADCHPLGIAGQVAGKSSNAQWASQQFWRKCGVDLNGAAPAVSSLLSAMRTYSGILAGPSDGPRHR